MKKLNATIIFLLSMLGLLLFFSTISIAAVDTSIIFAGNLGDSGGPYYIPPAESGTAVADGYYANSSYQIENWIYINTTVIGGTINSVLLHWHNLTTDIWDNTTSLINTAGNYYEVNTSGNITITNGHEYSFNIYASNVAGDESMVFWNKTGKTSTLVRRSVHLGCTPVNMNYTILYFYNEGFVTTDTGDDRLTYDGGTDGSEYAFGYLSNTVPGDDVILTACNLNIGWLFGNTSAVSPFTLDNFLLHLWYSTDDGDLDRIGWAKTRRTFYFFSPYTDSYNPVTTDSRCNITYDNGYATFSNNYKLESKLFDISDTSFTDNDIYEFIFGMDESGLGGSQDPTSICNRSFTSYLVLNVPDNATLNASHSDTDSDGLSDWFELYRSWTNPFLNDTDNDNLNDYWEQQFGSDPNNWKESFVEIQGYIADNYSNVMGGLVVNITNNNTGEYFLSVTNLDGLYTCNVNVSMGDVLFGSVASGSIRGTNETVVTAVNLSGYFNITVTPSLRARFVYAARTYRVNETVSFLSISDGFIIKWNWNFGDGHTAVGMTSNHVFTEPGQYIVSLTITGLDLNKDSYSKSVAILTLEEPTIPPPVEPEELVGYHISGMYDRLKVTDLAVSNSKLKVVVLDTGFTPTTYDGINMQNIKGYSLSRFDSAYDDNGHGTFVLYEIMYITQNKCPNAEIVSFKTFDKYGSAEPGDFLDALDAIKYLNPDIVSISAGAIGNPNDEYSMKVKELRERGIIVIAAAAGNLGPTAGTILSPACSDYAIAVGAFDTRGTPAEADDVICLWSSRGPVLDISPKPDVVAPGESIRGPWLYTEKSKSGTSMATPLIVGGTAAVVAQNKPLLDFVKIIYFWNLGVVGDAYEGALKDSCTMLGDENAWGAGVPDFVEVNDNFRNRLVLLISIPIVIIILIFAIAIYFYKRK